LRVPGCWDGFELTVRAILGQQVTVKGATILASRMASQFGRLLSARNGLTHLFPTPEAIAGADLSRVGLTRPRAETLRAFARAVCKKQISFDGVPDYDAFPSDDLGLRRSASDCTRGGLERRSEAWRPWRAYAVMLLWQSSGTARSGIQMHLRSCPYTALPLESGPW
jgi:AraC family transcriptional regulator, regulatory protein of adaptative response / DNA-3-methyladenine glycosylase II